ncbi:hypothetical protein NDU88_007463, partial [Pleurodeles waltl]
DLWAHFHGGRPWKQSAGALPCTQGHPLPPSPTPGGDPWMGGLSTGKYFFLRGRMAIGQGGMTPVFTKTGVISMGIVRQKM